MISKGIFKGLRKEMPELNKRTLKWFVKWWDERKKLMDILKKKELSIKEIEDFKKICKVFLEFGRRHLDDYKKYKIKWNVMEKYLSKDIDFCEKQLIIKKSIDLNVNNNPKTIKKIEGKKK